MYARAYARSSSFRRHDTRNCSCVRVVAIVASRQMDAGRDVKYKFNPGKSTERPAWPISGLCELFASIVVRVFALSIAIARGEQRGRRASDETMVWQTTWEEETFSNGDLFIKAIICILHKIIYKFISHAMYVRLRAEILTISKKLNGINYHFYHWTYTSLFFFSFFWMKLYSFLIHQSTCHSL